MTDTWTETIDRLNAVSQPAHGTPPTSEAAEPHGVTSWQPYTPPIESEAPAAHLPDPLILEVEQASHAPPPATESQPEPAPAIEPAVSVYGHADTPLPEPVIEPAPPVAEPAAPLVQAHAGPVLELSDPLGPPPVAAPLVAQTVKPVEPAAEPAKPAPIAAPLYAPAPLVAADPPPQPARLTVTETPIAQSSHDAIDPVLAGFDHVVALAGYVLLFISVFMFGVPALATVALAYAHKNDSHRLVRSHYRFQLRIFWTAILFVLLAIGSAVTAGGLAVTKLIDFVRANLPGVGAAMDRVGTGSWSGEIAGVLLIAAVTLGVLAVIWTLVASLFGFLRLVGNRPIGHQYATK